VHGINESQSFFHPPLLQALLYLRRNIEESPAGGNIEPQFFAVAFHFPSLFKDLVWEWSRDFLGEKGRSLKTQSSFLGKKGY
jgi:hypothetical protein